MFVVKFVDCWKLCLSAVMWAFNIYRWLNACLVYIFHLSLSSFSLPSRRWSTCCSFLGQPSYSVDHSILSSVCVHKRNRKKGFSLPHRPPLLVIFVWKRFINMTSEPLIKSLFWKCITLSVFLSCMSIKKINKWDAKVNQVTNLSVQKWVMIVTLARCF